MLVIKDLTTILVFWNGSHYGQLGATFNPFLHQKLYSEAVKDCAKAIELYDRNIKAYYRQALAYKEMKNYSDAHKAAKTGYTLQPSTVSRHLFSGKFWSKFDPLSQWQ